MRSLLSGSVFVVAVIACAACLFGCEDDLPVDPPPDKSIPGNLQLEVDYRSTHEIGFRCGSQDTVRPLELRIQYGPQRWWRQFTLQGEDTLFVLSGLQPGTEYLVNLIRIDEKGAVIDSTTPMMVSTLEIGVSHSYTWEEIEIGNYGSVCNDVWVHSDSCIYVVGNRLGEDPNQGHIARYDGKEWNIENIEIINQGEIRAVYGFSESDIWIGAGHNILHYDGTKFGEKWTRIPVDIPGRIRTIWGRRPDDVWFAGEEGTLMHWNGHSVESWHLSDNYSITLLTGDAGGRVYAYVIDKQPILQSSIWGYDGHEWSRLVRIEREGKTIDRYHMQYWIYGGGGLWCDETGGLFSGGRYLYRYINEEWYMPDYIEGNTIGSTVVTGKISLISGWNLSNIVFLNIDGDVYHMNGVDASMLYRQRRPQSLQISRMDAADNTICIVATRYDPINRGVIIVGRR